MTQTLLSLASTTLLFVFVGCCAASGMLQASAWMRHTREGVPASPRALFEPERYFDEIGLRQIVLSRWLVTLGAVAYLGFGAISLFSRVVG